MDPALLLVAGLAIILLLQFSRIRRQQREVRETRSALAVGAEVLTASGMIATVVEVTGATVTLAGQDGQRTRWVTGAVVRVIPETDPASSRYRDPAADGAAPDPGSAPQDGTHGGSSAARTDATTDATTDPTGDDAPGSTRQD